MNILITGARGNIGTYLNEYLSKENEVYSFGKDELNVCDKNSLLSTVQMVKPDLVIHCAALTNIDFCEANETAAYTVNTLGSLNVAYACSSLDIPIVYISTSYVYGDYKSTPYYETDECNPINIYGKTKLAGEKLIRTICKKYFIFRTSWVFGYDDCYIKKSLEKLSVPIFLCSDEIINPTYVEDLAYVISKIISSNFYGVYNCVNKDFATKYDVIKAAFDEIGIKKELIKIPRNYISNSAPRPKFSALDTSLLKNCFNIKLPSWKDRLHEYVKKM